MIHVQVTYKIRPDCFTQAEREISAFVESLQCGNRCFESYQVFRHASNNEAWVHVIAFKDPEAQLKHTVSPQVKSFVENMLGFCVVGPIYTELENVMTIG